MELPGKRNRDFLGKLGIGSIRGEGMGAENTREPALLSWGEGQKKKAIKDMS